MPIFQSTVVAKHLKGQNSEIIAAKWNIYKDHFLNPTIQENIRNSKEEQYQGGFIIDLFVNVLGYTKNPTPNFNITTEYKNIKDSKKADGAIIINEVVRAVIELKGTETTDLGKVESQAFGYKNNQLECTYVITSNFEKLRFYIDNAIEHIEFNLFTLSKEEFTLLYLCLALENIEKDIPKKIKEESLSEEDAITKKLYKDYSLFRRELHQSLVELNPQYDALTLFNKTQKLLDRFLFLFFAEDRHLLPPNSVRLILKQWNKLKELDAYTPLFNRFKKYFGYLNTGFKGKQYDVYAYNGGLFKTDEILDTITIDDNLLYKHTLTLSEYDFNSEVDVNILGHIFENSLTEIEEIQAQLEGQEIDKSKSKRKKDGVFYTPKYITKYIVENTVGKLCEEKKTELYIIEEDYISDKKRQKKTRKALLEKLTNYRNWLLQLTICDPACGSGAFLNQALDFLIAEHRYIDELQAKLFGDAMVLSDVENSILENNLFGVDINEESVEIAKLSLWLRTATPNRKLNDLSNNIKCGNSLIDDPEIAGDKAFNWIEEFPQIFAKGGFDVVIGNPPYGAELSQKEVFFIEKTFNSFEYQVNSYVIFYEKGLEIIRENGLLGYITPATFTYQHYFKNIREIFNSLSIVSISKYFYEVFDDADIGDSISWIIRKQKKTKQKIKISKNLNKQDAINFDFENIEYHKVVNTDGTYNLSESKLDIQSIILKGIPLSELCQIVVGIKPYQTNKGRPKQTKEIVKTKIFTSDHKVNESYIKCVIGKDFHRYTFINNPKMYLSYGEWLAEPRSVAPFFEKEKIIIRQTSDSIIGTIDSKQRVNLNNVYNLGRPNPQVSNKYLLALLNSKLLNLIYQNIAQEKGRLFAEVKKVNLAKIPIQISKKVKPILESKVSTLIDLNKELQEISQKFNRILQRKFELEKLPKKLQDWHLFSFEDFIKELKKKKIKLSLSEEAEWEDYFLAEQQKSIELKTKIDSTDREIDQMVYKLYGLTEEEIEIVENS